jgi:hypothetical protein
MAIKAKKKEYEAILAPEGTHIANLIQVIHIGTLNKEFKGKPKKSDTVRLTFELTDELYVFDEKKGEEPFVVSREFALSWSDKSNLKPFVIAMTGKDLRDTDEYDIANLLGKGFMVSVVHEEAKNGNIYANIKAATSLPKKTVAPEPINDLVEFSWYDEEGELQFDSEAFDVLPEFIQNKIMESEEYTQAEELGLIQEDEDEELPPPPPTKKAEERQATKNSTSNTNRGKR